MLALGFVPTPETAISSLNNSLNCNERAVSALRQKSSSSRNSPVSASKSLGVALAVVLAVSAQAREARKPDWEKIAGGRQAEKPILAVIGLGQQKITVYDSAGPVLQAPISTGRRSYETPAGIFTILQKNRDHVSNLYDDAEMPFMQRITWSGIALHAGPLPGYRASHGCVRLPHRFAERLFALTSVGMRVVIVPEEAQAVSVSHPLLERLKAEGDRATSLADADVAREAATRWVEAAQASAKAAQQATAKKKRAETALDRAQKRLDAAMQRAEAAKPGAAKDRAQVQVEKLRGDVTAKAADADAAATFARMTTARKMDDERRAREARSRAWPLSLMVSGKTQRLYVRQGFEPVLDLPVTIRETERPLGTHAFYATETMPRERGWLGVSVRASGEAPTAVLDRIELSPEATALLANSAWLGSALIVTDEAPYKETAAGTDFLVVMSDEPQGALKIRTPEPAQKAPLVAQSPIPRQQPIRAYRSMAQDTHFRHPLGFFP
jgi:hypothetical protein